MPTIDPYRTIKRRIADNRAPCACSGCFDARYGVSRYCKPHLRANRTHGHPRGVRISRSDYEAEYREVQRLLRDHASTHTGTQNALALVDKWMQRAARGDSDVIGQRELARLARHGVTAERVLAEAAAIFTYSRRNTHRLPDDQRLDFALANNLLRLAPREERSRYTFRGYVCRRYVSAPKDERQKIGQAIRETLGLYLLNVSTALDERARARAIARLSLVAPFPPTTDKTIP